MVGDRMRVSAPFAAFLNAFASHVLDLDDVYNPPGTTVHGSCSVWPAILAVADTRPVSGRDALASFALGFEAETRVAHAAGQTHYDVGWHVTGTSGHVGAAAAAARTMGLGQKQVEHAIAAGATQAAGLRIMAGSDLKSMHPGKAAMDGVLAATLAAYQLTAGAKALEGDFGYLAVMSTDPAPEKISAGLGETWNLTSNGHKLYPSGSLTHPMIDGVIALVTDDDVAPGRRRIDRHPRLRTGGTFHRSAAADHAHAGEVQPAPLRGGGSDLPAGGYRGTVAGDPDPARRRRSARSGEGRHRSGPG